MPDASVQLSGVGVTVSTGTAPAEPADYFTVEEYRAVAGDRTVPYKAEDDDIIRAQRECISRLEEYAASAWQIRTVTEVAWCPIAVLETRRIPIVAVTSLVIDEEAYSDLSELMIDANAGTVRWGDWSAGTVSAATYGTGRAVITYTYGHDGGANGVTVPQWVKRPLIQACQSLVREEEGNTKVPRNTTRYSSEKTDLQIGRRGPYKPWPWDARASDDFQAAWAPRRPRPFMT